METKNISPYLRPNVNIVDTTDLNIRQLWEAARSQKELEKTQITFSDTIQHRKAS